MSALPANFWDDLNDPDVEYAEQLVYDSFRSNQLVDSVNRKVRA